MIPEFGAPQCQASSVQNLVRNRVDCDNPIIPKLIINRSSFIIQIPKLNSLKST